MKTRKISFNVQCGRKQRTQSVIEQVPDAGVDADGQPNPPEAVPAEGDQQELRGEFASTPIDEDMVPEAVADAEDTDDEADPDHSPE